MTTAAPASIDANRGPWLTALLSLLLGFASISTDLYLPALPSMGGSLNATQGALELTISAYLLGFAGGQLLWGPVSDRFGRKVPLMIGVAVFILGAAGCALSTGIGMLIAARVAQAIGASAAVVLGRAMVRDLFPPTEAARKLSTLMMIMAIAPLIGPPLGAQILALSSWHAIFWVVAGIGLVTFGGVARTPESLPGERRTAASLASAFSTYLQHLRNLRLLAYAGALGFFGAGIFAFVAGSSFVFIRYYGVDPSLYGIVFALSIVGILAANALNRRLLLRRSSTNLLLAGTVVATTAGVLLVAQVMTGWGGVVAFCGLVFLFIAMNGFINANAIAGGLASVTQGTGAASAILGCAQYGGGMLGSAAVGLMANGTPLPMAGLIALTSAACAGCALWLARDARDNFALPSS